MYEADAHIVSGYFMYMQLCFPCDKGVLGCSLTFPRPPHSDASSCIMRIHLPLGSSAGRQHQVPSDRLAKGCDMQCACTSAVDKVLAYCLAGSRQETTGQVIYIYFYTVPDCNRKVDEECLLVL